VGDGYEFRAQRFRRQHDRLDGASFFELLSSELSNAMQLEQWHSPVHSLVQGVRFTGKEDSAVLWILAKRFVGAGKKSGVVSLCTFE
jgi:hypothetical protein